MKFFAIAILMIVFLPGLAQEDLSLRYVESISSEDLYEHLNILASDALEGRETGERGQKMAAAYLQYFFKSNGLDPIVKAPAGNSFLQSFNLVKTEPGKTWIQLSDKKYENLQDFIFIGSPNYKQPIKTHLIFVGSGGEKDLEAINVSGKSVLIYSNGNKKSREEKMKLALKSGAENVFIMQSGSPEDFESLVLTESRKSKSGKLRLPPENEGKGYFLIPLSMGAEILNTTIKTIETATERANDGKYASLLKLRSNEITFFASQYIEKISTENVLGLIEGTDRKDEYIIITAHYDHIGIDGDEINNGADDDGSGTVAVMEIAQAFSLAKQAGHGPRRSLIFMAVTGEEKGLFGSAYYVSDPIVPLQKTVTNLNIDMVGRIDPKHEENPNYVYVIGADRLSTELHELSEKANATYSNLDLDYTYNEKNDPNRFYYRSDHYNFAKNGIPVIFYFNGTHADYHRPSDTIEKIDFDLLTRRTKLIYHTAWEIANREDRISLDEFQKE